MNDGQAIAICDALKSLSDGINSELSYIGSEISSVGCEISIRDKFAMAALSGGLEQGVEGDMGGWFHPPSYIAERAFAIADAMIYLSELK